MIGDVLMKISRAEAEADEICKHAERELRKIEARNYADIQKVRDEVSAKMAHAVKTMEQDALIRARATVSIENPSKQKIQSARDYIVSYIIGGAS